MEFTKESKPVAVSKPVALDDELWQDEEPYDERRIWIGNIDVGLSEFVVLKLVQPFGELVSFDYIYHKTGPDKGQPRGFCFVTYKDKLSASRMVSALNGYRLNGRRLLVRVANKKTANPPSRAEPGPASADHKHKIAAIEAKLRDMERQPSSLPVVRGTNKQGKTTPTNPAHRSKPYDRTLKIKQ